MTAAAPGSAPVPASAPACADACPLCEGAGGRVVWQGPAFRVVHAQEAGFPAFYRLIWNGHVREFSDLAPAERALCMEAAAAIEQALRDTLAPTKMNLATLGNQVPHLHWHLIARFDWDSHFPAPVWAVAQRAAPPERLAALQTRLPVAEREILRRLAALNG